MPTSILIISGTNRPDSSALKISRIIEAHYKTAKIPANLFSLEELPQEMFNPSAYDTKPPAVIHIQDRILAAHGLHIVCPEYNGSFPGVLKYLIDMLKFPESFQDKPVAFVGESAGTFGSLRAVEHLQDIFAYRNAHLYPDRVFIPAVHTKLDTSGRLTDPDIDQRLAKQTVGFRDFISRIRREEPI
jgi:chromate reductase, NAD(P)H dehydrogenase (quinone)